MYHNGKRSRLDEYGRAGNPYGGGTGPMARAGYAGEAYADTGMGMGSGGVQPMGMNMGSAYGSAMGMGMGTGMVSAAAGVDMGYGGTSGMGAYEHAFPAVKLRGLPFSASEDDVRAFMACGQPEPVDVLLCCRNGRFSGEAFVVLGAAYQLELALQKNRTYLGRRYVEVFMAKKMDYYKAIVQFMTSTEQPAQQMRFSDRPARDMPHRDRRYDEGHDAALQHRGAPEQGHSMQQQSGQHPTRQHQQQPPPSATAVDPAEHTGVLKLRGLPFSSTKQDILDWFSDLQLASFSPDGIHIVIAYDGRPTGMAFVEFASPEDAAAAMAKDRQMLGSRYVELFPSSREEAMQMSTGGQY